MNISTTALTAPAILCDKVSGGAAFVPEADCAGALATGFFVTDLVCVATAVLGRFFATAIFFPVVFFLASFSLAKAFVVFFLAKALVVFAALAVAYFSLLFAILPPRCCWPDTYSPDKYFAMASRSPSLSAFMKPGISRLLVGVPVGKSVHGAMARSYSSARRAAAPVRRPRNWADGTAGTWAKCRGSAGEPAAPDACWVCRPGFGGEVIGELAQIRKRDAGATTGAMIGGALAIAALIVV